MFTVVRDMWDITASQIVICWDNSGNKKLSSHLSCDFNFMNKTSQKQNKNWFNGNGRRKVLGWIHGRSKMSVLPLPRSWEKIICTLYNVHVLENLDVKIWMWVIYWTEIAHRKIYLQKFYFNTDFFSIDRIHAARHDVRKPVDCLEIPALSEKWTNSTWYSCSIENESVGLCGISRIWTWIFR